MVNVLLSCAGRRNYLVEFFRQALSGRGRVLATDSSGCAAALQDADQSFVVPRLNVPDYIDVLVEICRSQEVRLLVGLNDVELPLLANNRERFLAIGTRPVVADPVTIDLCFDKLKTIEFLTRHGLSCPKTVVSLEACRKALSRGELSFPLVVKPRWGTGSLGIEFPSTWEELDWAWRLGHERVRRSAVGGIGGADNQAQLLIQEVPPGHEYGLDVVNDLDGNHVATWVKRKLGMRAGETDQAVTEDHPGLSAVGARLGQALRHPGNLDCDVFLHGEECRVLDLNPRFGGGYPFSHAAGANLPAALIAWSLGETPCAEWFKLQPGVVAAKYDRLTPMRAKGVEVAHTGKYVG